MTRENWFQREQLRLLLLVLPFLFLLVFWPDIPVRFQVSGMLGHQGDSYASKYTLLVIPVLNVLLGALFWVLNYRVKEPEPAIGHVWQLLSHLLLAYLFLVAGIAALGYKPETELIFKYGLICLFLILGSYLGTLPRNGTFGFRLPWTWNSQVIWHQTHRFAAKLWVYASLLMLIYPDWQKHQEWLFPVYVGLLGVVPVFYSYFLFKKQPRNPPPSSPSAP